MTHLMFALLLNLNWSDGDTTHKGYYIKYGTQGVWESKIDVGNIHDIKIDLPLVGNKNCVIVVAYGPQGESPASDEYCFPIPAKPVGFIARIAD